MYSQASHHFNSPTPLSSTSRLAELRIIVINHLKDLETWLAELESPLRELGDKCGAGCNRGSLHGALKRTRSGSIVAIDDARTRISDGLEMLSRIRADVCSHLPDLPRLHSLQDLSFDDVYSHIVTFELPELSTPFKPSLDDFSSSFDRLQSPLSYLPTLACHLKSLNERLGSLQRRPSLSLHIPSSSLKGRISDLLAKLPDPDLFNDPIRSPIDFLGDAQATFELDQAGAESKRESQIQHALAKSLCGKRLISYKDLPHGYKNDEFVETGYRFIPLFRWPWLLLSVFQFHNETANIWTHLLPLVLSLVTFSSTAFPHAAHPPQVLPLDPMERIFMLSAGACLLFSCVWHLMAGCAHWKAMETAARIDYVGIGWLISASISSVTYYGFGCRPQTAAIYLAVCFVLGFAGTILPFMTWFNERGNKKWRIMFYLCLIFTMMIPLAHLAVLHSLWEMYTFIRPEFASMAAYTIGLISYAFHFPQCVVPMEWRRYTDWIGGGSHAIWHLFIVLAIKLHKDAMVEYRQGIGGEVCALDWDWRSDGVFGMDFYFTR